MLQLSTAKNGQLTATYAGKTLHSAYNPKSEAERFVCEQNLKPNNYLILLLTGGIGHIEAEILQQLPQCTLLTISPDGWLQHSIIDNINKKSLFVWQPQNNLALEAFLSQFINDKNVDELKIIGWPAGINSLQAFSQQCLKQIKAFIMRLKQSLATTGHFGPLWFNNVFTNFIRQDRLALLNSSSLQRVVIAASGPSLANALPYLKKNRPSFFLIALTSSLKALHYYNLKPDCIVAIDGGYYAKLALHSLNNNEIVASPLLASPHRKVCYRFGLGSFFEKALLEPDSPTLIWQGTVMASALHLAQYWAGNNPIFLCGFDLNFTALNTHVRPHNSDTLYLAMSNRLQPLTTIYQYLALHGKQSLASYADYFKQNTWPSNIKIVTDGNNSLPFATLPLSFINQWDKVETASFNSVPSPSLQQRRAKVNDLLHKYYDALSHNPCSSVASELFFYLATDCYSNYKKAINNNENSEELMSILITKTRQSLNQIQLKFSL
jgi:hypothetical protein